MTHPSITVTSHKRYQGGFPWIYSNELKMDAEAKALTPGSVVRLCDIHGTFLGMGYFNPHSLIAVRVLSRVECEIDATFVGKQLAKALALRDAFIANPCYRLIHSEADSLPGVIIDRYNNDFVIQLNTAGADLMKPAIEEAMQTVFPGSFLSFKQSQPIRALEGLEIIEAELESRLVEGQEGSIKFLSDVTKGQKTGWYYDQRDNRALLQSISKDKSVLDVYSFTGAFALNALKGGASKAISVDSSASALEIAKKNAELNNLPLETRCGEAFDVLAKLEKSSFDIVIIDPPAFVKSKKDYQSGLRGYLKLVNLAHPLVKNGGFLLFTSCSHHVTLNDMHQVLALSLKNRDSRIVKTLTASVCHPQHPHLPESEYLKGFLVAL